MTRTLDHGHPVNSVHEVDKVLEPENRAEHQLSPE